MKIAQIERLEGTSNKARLHINTMQRSKTTQNICAMKQGYIKYRILVQWSKITRNKCNKANEAKQSID